VDLLVKVVHPSVEVLQGAKEYARQWVFDSAFAFMQGSRAASLIIFAQISDVEDVVAQFLPVVTLCL
jgi:hypothetical protein